MTGVVTIELLHLPIALHARATEHQEALRRELAFVEGADAPDAAPQRLQALAAELDERYGQAALGPNDELQAAVATGAEHIDLRYELPAIVAEDCRRLGAMLDELDEFCRTGDLLTLVTPPDALAYRQWFLQQCIDQAEGRGPTLWSDALIPAEHRSERRAGGTATSDKALTVKVDDDLDLKLASNLRLELLAHIERGQRDLVVDLRDCEFVDSTGLSLLLTTRARCVEEGGSFRVVNLAGNVERLLDIAGVRELLTGDGAA